jgi:phosphomannomutase
MGVIDNGILSMITMLNILTMKREPLSRLGRQLQKYARLDETNFPVRDIRQLFRMLEQAYRNGRKEHLDGLSVEYDAWWFNLRESHTEPVVRLVMEADDQSTLAREKARLLVPYS